MWRLRLLVISVSLVLRLFGPMPARAADVPCTTVIAEVNHRVTRHRAIDISEVAKKLDSRIVWVEGCLKTYGRRYKRPGFESDGGRDEVFEGVEAGGDEEQEDLDDPEQPNRR